MNQTISEDFLRDLIRFLRRHGPEPFVALGEALASEDKRGQIIRALGQLAEVAAKARTTTSRRSQHKASLSERARDLIESLRPSNPEAADLLQVLHESLSARKILSTKSAVLRFCHDLDLPAPASASRARAVLALLRHLSTLEPNQIQAAAEKAARMGTESNGDYERLATALMQARRRGS